ncbi:hypothetical protein SK128_013835 [Halocaridina rubra]|uniref:Enoyl reductase (ER) domain-containing protein n=1 Tax=Halocaridina rubra TaxID=373956 RepID=A0AAN8X8I6_HALRR
MVRRIIVKAIGGYDQLQVVDGPDVPAPVLNQVTVEVKACGLNFFDTYVRQGISPYIQPPCVLGLECSGKVIAVGDGVTSFKIGDRVVVHTPNGGACAEQINVDETSILHIPDSMSYEIAASFTVNYLTAYFSLFHFGGIREGGAVLIHGAAGGVGWAATQLAKSIPDVTVFGTASSHKHEIIGQNGVDYPISHSQDYKSEVLKYRKKGVSVVLDSLSGPDFMTNQQLLEPLGKVVLIGARGMVGEEYRSLWRVLKTWWQTKTVSPHSLVMNNNGVAGFNLHELRSKDFDTFLCGWKEITCQVASDKLHPRVDSVWKFESIVEASKQISERKNIGKVIIKP